MEIQKKPWEIDVAVLCIFFVRDKQFRETFEQVKKARPRVLLLWQDGPREGRPDDIEGVKRCREIAEDIDWDCEVHKMYHEKNYGCDPSTFYSHKWAFSIVEKCIILEDDIVVSQSFFPFCKELLDKYETDERVDRICGQILFGGINDNRYSYFFAKHGSSWGWASWRRVAETWDENYAFLDDDYYMDLLDRKVDGKSHQMYVKHCRQHKADGVAHWEKIISFSMLLNSRLVIYPTVNLVHNNGASENATHATSNVNEIPKSLRQMFFMKTGEVQFPLKHPPYMIEDYHYIDKMTQLFSSSVFKRASRKLEYTLLRMKTGNFKSIGNSIKRRFTRK